MKSLQHLQPKEYTQDFGKLSEDAQVRLVTIASNLRSCIAKKFECFEGKPGVINTHVFRDYVDSKMYHSCKTSEDIKTFELFSNEVTSKASDEKVELFNYLIDTMHEDNFEPCSADNHSQANPLLSDVIEALAERNYSPKPF